MSPFLVSLFSFTNPFHIIQKGKDNKQKNPETERETLGILGPGQTQAIKQGLKDDRGEGAGWEGEEEKGVGVPFAGVSFPSRCLPPPSPYRARLTSSWILFPVLQPERERAWVRVYSKSYRCKLSSSHRQLLSKNHSGISLVFTSFSRRVVTLIYTCLMTLINTLNLVQGYGL